MAERDGIFWRVDPELKRTWTDFCRARGTDRNHAGAALLKWFLAQDDVLKALIIAQVPDRDDVRRLLIVALKKPPRRRRK